MTKPLDLRRESIFPRRYSKPAPVSSPLHRIIATDVKLLKRLRWADKEGDQVAHQ